MVLAEAERLVVSRPRRVLQNMLRMSLSYEYREAIKEFRFESGIIIKNLPGWIN